MHAAKHSGPVLNESSNHYYLHYHKHDPTTDVIASNTTAGLELFI